MSARMNITVIQGIQEHEVKTLWNLFFSKMLANISVELWESWDNPEEIVYC